MVAADSRIETRRSPSPAADDRSQARPAGGYRPGLDGLRAVAVLLVIGYHHSPAAVPGGFLGVSTFFVLSGYLIGSLCFAEVARTGTIRARRFWERRIRRLLPAALVTLLGVVAMGRIWGITGGPGQQRGDLLAALTWGANWRFLAQDSGYQTAFADPSPVQHFWSLAIEEQFYLLFPLLVIGLVRMTRRRWTAIRLLVAALTLAAVGLATRVADTGGFEQAYYATYTRAGELLVGVLLAALLAGGSAGLARARMVPTTVQISALLGLVGLIVLAGRVDLGAPHLFSAIIPLNALCTVGVVVGCLLTGPVATVLAVWPLRMLGRISYGVYLFHWPLFLLLDEQRTGLHGPSLFIVRLAVTVGCAAVSYHLVESPIRFRRLVPSRRVVVSAAAGLSLTALVIVAVPARQSPAQRQTASIPLAGMGGFGDAATPSRAMRIQHDVVEPTGRAPATARILVIGDSVAWTLLPGFSGWNRDHPGQQLAIDAFTQMGCPLLGGPEAVEIGGEVNVVWPGCRRLVQAVNRAVGSTDYEAVLVVMGLADLGNRRFGDRWRHLGQAAYDRRLRTRMDDLAHVLRHDRVFWATYPRVRVPEIPGRTGPGPFDENDPDRLRALNGMIEAIGTRHAHVTVLDLDGWCESLPKGCLDDALRPDGVHFSWPGSHEADAWMVPRILRGAATPGHAP